VTVEEQYFTVAFEEPQRHLGGVVMITSKYGILGAATVAAVISFGAVKPAHAATATDLLPLNNSLGIYLKDFPSGLNEHKIYLDDNTDAPVVGHYDSQNGLPIVNFTSPSSLDPANGFANIKPASGDTYNQITFTVPGYSFGDFLFDLQLFNNKDGLDLTITAFNGITQLGTLTLTDQTDPDVKHDADMSFLVLAENSAVITKVVLDSISGFNETKHFQVSELKCIDECGPNPGPGQVPLPAALPLFAGGLGVIGLLASRRKRKQSAPSAAA
jgi:hypothetical protein